MRPLCVAFKTAVTALLLLWAAVVLAGCSAGGGEAARVRQLTEGFSQSYETDFTCALEALELEGRLSRRDPEACTIELTGPPSLAGLAYRLDSDGVELRYARLSFTLDETAGSAGQTAPLLRASAALSALLAPDDESPPTPVGEDWAVSKTVDGAGWTLLLSGETGLPLKLSPDGGEMEITLENFVFFG